MSGPLTRSAVRGVTWLSISQAAAQIVRYASMIVLARLLFPQDFGVVATATIVTDLVLQVIDLGFGEALIQRKEVNQGHLSVTFWSGLGLGIIFCILTVAIAPFLADFFRAPLVGPVLAVSSVCFVIAPLRIVHGTLLRRKLDFFRFSIADIGQGISSAVVSMALAFAGFGVWSLVIGNIAGQVVLAVIRWIMSPWRPSLMFSLTSAKELWGFGSNIIGNRIVGSIGDRLDYLIGGRLLSSGALGYYYLGVRTAGMIPNFLYMAVNRVAFPAFSAVQDEGERLRRGFIKSITYVSIAIFPLSFGLAILSPELVKVVFGPKWIPTILPMQLLCIAAAFSTIVVTVGPMLLAKGKPGVVMKLSLLRLMLLIPSLLIGARYGITGLAGAVAGVNAILWPVQQWFVHRTIGLRARDYLESLGPAALGCAVMSATVVGFRYAAINFLHVPDLWVLICSALLGFVSFYATLKLARIKALDDMIELGLEMVSPQMRRAASRMPLVRRLGNQPSGNHLVEK